MCSVWLAWQQESVSNTRAAKRQGDWLTPPRELHLVLLEGLRKLVCNLVRCDLAYPCKRHDQGSVHAAMCDNVC